MSGTRIRIAARLRPKLPGEVGDDTVNIQVDDDGSSFISINNPRDQKQRTKFRFDSCHGERSTQEEIFNKDVVPLLHYIHSGVTVTIFAYGVTSSGKTYTMQGGKSDPGITPRVVKYLLECNPPPGYTMTYTTSFMEIYVDDVYDLLGDRKKTRDDMLPKVHVRECEGQIFVADLTEHPISTITDFHRLYSVASKNRSVGATNLNSASSRSHAIVVINVRLDDKKAGKSLLGKINLVDLAGSENNKRTGNDEERMRESKAINKSLSTLGQVVHGLNRGHARLPYRNSKLTRLLQDALGGSAIGLLICNLAPGIKFRGDTWNTLTFASLTKQVENKPVVHVREGLVQKSTTPLPPLLPQSTSEKAVPPPISGPSRPSLTGENSKNQSRLPAPVGGRRSSTLPSHGASYQFQPFAMPAGPSGSSADVSRRESRGRATGMTDQEMEDRILKVVDQMLDKRLEAQRQEFEKEKALLQQEAAEKLQELLRQQQELSQDIKPSCSSTNASNTPELNSQLVQESAAPVSLPSGVLTPLLQRHQDLDDELNRRLQELEERHEMENKELRLADVLSPVSRKKTGRAYVALARAHSQKGDMHVALDLYRKAATYVPDNERLHERILEVEFAIKNGVELKPEPKRQPVKKEKNRGKKRGSGRASKRFRDFLAHNDHADRGAVGEHTNADGAAVLPAGLGILDETTNASPTRSPKKGAIRAAKSPTKRRRRLLDGEDDTDYEVVEHEGRTGSPVAKVSREKQASKRPRSNEAIAQEPQPYADSSIEFLGYGV